MVEVSDFCIILKDIPYDEDDTFVRLCLKRWDGASLENIVKLQSHEEREADKRWIVLFKSKEVARACIQHGSWQVNSEKHGQVTVTPDYCSECIIPDDWEGLLSSSESKAGHATADSYGVPSGQLDLDLKSRSDFVAAKNDLDSWEVVDKSEIEDGFVLGKKLKIQNESIRSEDLFGSRRNNKLIFSDDKPLATTHDNQRNHGQCHGFDKEFKVTQDSVRSEDLFGSRTSRTDITDKEHLATALGNSADRGQPQADRNQLSKEFSDECCKIDDKLDELEKSESLKDEALREKVKPQLTRNSKGTAQNIAAGKIGDSLDFMLSGDYEDVHLQMQGGADETGRTTEVEDLAEKLKDVGIVDGGEVAGESFENGFKKSSVDDRESAGFDASQQVSMAHREKYEKHHQFQQKLFNKNTEDFDQTKKEDEGTLPIPLPSGGRSSQIHRLLPEIPSKKGLAHTGEAQQDEAHQVQQNDEIGDASVKKPAHQSGQDLSPDREVQPPEERSVQSSADPQDSHSIQHPGHQQGLLSQSPVNPQMSGYGLQHHVGPNSNVYLLAQVPPPTTTAPSPSSHQQVYSYAYASSPNSSPAEPLNSNVVTDETYMVPRPKPCRVSTPASAPQPTPHSPGQPGPTSQSTPQSPLQPAFSNPVHRELPPIPCGMSNPTYMGHPPKPHAFANPEYSDQPHSSHAVANPIYMTNQELPYYNPNAIPTASGVYALIETKYLSPTPHEIPVNSEYLVPTPRKMTTVSENSETSPTGTAVFIQSKPGKLIDPLHILDLSNKDQSVNNGESFRGSGTYVTMGDVEPQMSEDYISMDGKDMEKIREIRASQGDPDGEEDDVAETVELRHINTGRSKPQRPKTEVVAGNKERRPEDRSQRSQSLDLEAAIGKAGGNADRTVKIRVLGIGPTTSKETLELFFENKKRCSGGDIQEIEFNKERRQAVITYNLAEVAENVVSRVNREGFFALEGAKLSVDLYVPPPVEKKKALVTGIHPKTSEDSLMFYLEKNCGREVVDIVLGETAGTALVTFKTDIDLKVLQSKCIESPLEGNVVRVEPVQSTDCVLVTGLPSSATIETLELYFENRRRSMGMDVTEVRLLDTGTALVYFQDCRVAEQVSEREHTVCDAKLEVSLFYECLGMPRVEKCMTAEPAVRPKTSLKKESMNYNTVNQQTTTATSAVNEPSPKLRLPAPVDFPEVNSYLFKFLFHSKQYKKKFEEEVAKVGGYVTWSEQGEDMSVVSSSKMDQASVEAWESSVVDTVRSVLNVFTVADLSVAQEAWNDVVELLKQLDVKCPEGVSVFLQNDTCTIVLAGHSAIVKTVKAQVLDIVNKAEKKLKESKTVVTKKEALKTVQLQLLWAAKFPKVAQSNFKGLKVELDIDRRGVTFIGLSADVSKAMIQMHETLNSFMSRTFHLSKPAKDLLFKTAARDYLKKKLRSGKVLGVWDVVHNQDEVVMYGHDEKQVRQGISIIQEHLQQGSIKIDFQRNQMLQSKEWRSLMEELNIKYKEKFLIVQNQDSIQVVGTLDIFNDGLKEVEKFFELHILREEFFRLEKGEFRFFRKCKKDDVKSIEKQFRALSVQLIPEDTKEGYGFRIKGKKDGCKLASVKLKDLVKSVQKSQHSVKAKPGAEEFFTSPEGVDRLKNIEQRNKCVIELDLESRTSADTRMSKPEVRVICHLGSHKIVVMAGDMTELHVDVMVNAANSQLQLGAGIAGAIFEKGGEKIQHECDDVIQRCKHELADGEIATTGPGNLTCKLIVHAVAPVWKGGHNNERFLLGKAVRASLETAHANRHTTIALPAIGAGIFGFPIKEATKIIVETIDYFFSKTGVGSHSKIQTIYLCDVKEDTVKSFHAALDNQFGTRFEVVSGRNSESEEADTSSESDYEDEEIFEEEEEEEVDRGGTMRTSASDQWQQNKIKISVIKGELAKHQVDVIVNSTSEFLDLNVGAISRSIVKEGGSSILTECQKLYPKGIKYGQIATTSGGNLKCRKVYHGCLKRYDRSEGSTLQLMQDFVTVCLSTMEKFKYTSIAFPALGTGALGFPADLVARVMFETTISYELQNPGTCIRNVDLVIYPKDDAVFKAFEYANGTYQPAGGATGTATSNFTKSRTRSSQNSQGSISSQGSTSSPNLRRKRSEKSRSPSSTDNLFRIGQVSLEVLQGDITKEKADVIVNSVLPNMDLSQGTLSRAILLAAGGSIAGEWRTQDAEKHGFAVTSGGQLQCQRIFHICARQDSGWWEHIVGKCLEEADKRKYKSISFPALGTGGFGMSVDKIASAMFCAVKEFAKLGHVGHVRKVRFVVFQQDMVNIFMKAATGSLTVKKGLQTHLRDLRRRVSGAAQRSKRTKVENIGMVIYCDSRSSMNGIKMDIDELRGDIATSQITAPTGIIMNLRQHQVEKMQTMGSEDFVMVDVNTTLGLIEINGGFKSTRKVEEKIEAYLRNIEKDKRRRQEQRNTYQSAGTAQLRSSGSQQPTSVFYPPQAVYPPQTSNLQSAGSGYPKTGSGPPTTGLQSPWNSPHPIPTQPQSHGSSHQSAVATAKLPADVPTTWAPMYNAEPLKIVSLKKDSQEFKYVASKFCLTSLAVGYGNENIVQIERIQNPELYRKFADKKRSMQSTLGRNQVSRDLWYGTESYNTKTMNAYGFSSRYYHTGGSFGCGIYFAVNSSLCLSWNTCPPGQVDGCRHLYFAEVLTGDSCIGNPGMMSLPPKYPNNPSVTYDSACDNFTVPNVFVIFKANQAYPHYHITFK